MYLSSGCCTYRILFKNPQIRSLGLYFPALGYTGLMMFHEREVVVHITSNYLSEANIV